MAISEIISGYVLPISAAFAVYTGCGLLIRHSVKKKREAFREERELDLAREPDRFLLSKALAHNNVVGDAVIRGGQVLPLSRRLEHPVIGVLASAVAVFNQSQNRNASVLYFFDSVQQRYRPFGDVDVEMIADVLGLLQASGGDMPGAPQTRGVEDGT